MEDFDFIEDFGYAVDIYKKDSKINKFLSKIFRKKRYIWNSKSERRIPITKMTDAHLLNTINFLENKIKDFRMCKLFLKEMKREKSRRLH